MNQTTPIFSPEKAGALILRGHEAMEAKRIGTKTAILFRTTAALIEDIDSIRANADTAKQMMHRCPIGPREGQAA